MVAKYLSDNFNKKLNDKLFTKKVNKKIFKLNEIGKIISYLRPDIFTTLLSLPAFIKV